MYYSYSFFGVGLEKFASIEDFIESYWSAIYDYRPDSQYNRVPTLYDDWTKQPVSIDYIVNVYHQMKRKRDAYWHNKRWENKPYKFRCGPVPGINNKKWGKWHRSPRYIQQIRENAEYNRGYRFSLVKWEDPPVRHDCRWNKSQSWKNNKKRSRQWDR